MVTAIGRGEPQTLADILQARDERQARHDRLLRQYNHTLLSYKLNMPGSVKSNRLLCRVFDEGLRVIKAGLQGRAMPIVFEETLYQNSGPEFFGVVAAAAGDVKALSMDIEDTHPLGRLYDIDILDATGKKYDRSDMQRPERRCLICDQPAFVCGRSRAHSSEELLVKIQGMYDAYFFAGGSYDHNT